MEDQAAQWLVREFSLLGIHFQNWMTLALAIAVLSILYVDKRLFPNALEPTVSTGPRTASKAAPVS